MSINTIMKNGQREKASKNPLSKNTNDITWIRTKFSTLSIGSQITQELKQERQQKYTKNNYIFTHTKQPWHHRKPSNFWTKSSKIQNGSQHSTGSQQNSKMTTHEIIPLKHSEFPAHLNTSHYKKTAEVNDQHSTKVSYNSTMTSKKCLPFFKSQFFLILLKTKQ